MQLERMRMYQAAEALAGEVQGLLRVARRRAPLQADHLERSADSVLFNTAEGIGSYKPKVKITAYDVARKEASEVRAILRRLVLSRVFTSHQVALALELAGSCVGMLTAAIRAVEKRDAP